MKKTSAMPKKLTVTEFRILTERLNFLYAQASRGMATSLVVAAVLVFNQNTGTTGKYDLPGTFRNRETL